MSDPPAASGTGLPAGSACGTDDWLTYGHDSRRTSASAECCTGPFETLWTFAPHRIGPREARISHVIADAHSVYAVGFIGVSPAAYRLDEHGKVVWTFDSHVDIHRDHWPTLALDSLLVNDDGLYVIDATTGKNRYDRGLDAWGQSLSDGTRWFMVNTWHVAGPEVFVGAFNARAESLWRQYRKGQVFGDVMDDVGGIALDGSTLFYAADYKFESKSFVAGLDADSGEPRWSRPTYPLSALSAGSGRVVLVETTGRGKPRSLVARSQSDGSAIWSAPVQEPSTAAPVLAGDMVIIETAAAVAAFDAATGTLRWTAKTGSRTRTAVRNTTALAAAMGSHTLLTTRRGHLFVLSLENGQVQWNGQLGVSPGEFHSPVMAGGRIYAVAGGIAVALAPSR